MLTCATLIFLAYICCNAAKCNTNTKCNNINAKCNKINNAKRNNFPTQNVITQIVITPELQVCST